MEGSVRDRGGEGGRDHVSGITSGLQSDGLPSVLPKPTKPGHSVTPPPPATSPPPVAPPTAPVHDQGVSRATEHGMMRAEGDGASHPPPTDAKTEGKRVQWLGAQARKPGAVEARNPARIGSEVSGNPECEAVKPQRARVGKPVKAEKPVRALGNPVNHMVGSEGRGGVEATQPRKVPATSGTRPRQSGAAVGAGSGPSVVVKGGERATAQHSTRQQEACKDEDAEQHGLLLSLQEKARENDYYRLLRVSPSASSEELAGARRDRTRQLHPDHFANDDTAREL